MSQAEVRQDPNFVANEVNAYTVTILAGSQCVGRFNELNGAASAAGGATVAASYAMTYLMGVVDMAEMCARAARGMTLDEVLAHVDERVRELCEEGSGQEGDDGAGEEEEEGLAE